jgi:hypothetical protein
MIEMSYNYLTGVVEILADAPDSWRELPNLPFWENPNSDLWGHSICRSLYHETFHFWQFISSGYIARLVEEEWSRFLSFEQSGEIEPISSEAMKYIDKKGRPFSVKELVECWARFWDVHTRSPVEILRQEIISVEDFAATLELSIPGMHEPAYSGESFDLVMQHGKDCESYANPYRWLLNEMVVTGASSIFSNVVFPIITHTAFKTENPLDTFFAAIERAKDSGELMRGVFGDPDTMSKRKSIVQLWQKLWNRLIPELIDSRSIQSLETGLNRIESGPLKEHPIFKEVPLMESTLGGYFKMGSFSGAGGLSDPDDRFPVFGLPGIPQFRVALGRFVPPPKIEFSNFSWYCPEHGVSQVWQLMGKGDKFSLSERVDDLQRRVVEFREAIVLEEKGLPADFYDIE